MGEEESPQLEQARKHLQVSVGKLPIDGIYWGKLTPLASKI